MGRTFLFVRIPDLESKLIDWLIALCQFLLIGLILISGYFEHLSFGRSAGVILRMLSVVVLAIGTIGLLTSAATLGQKITPLPAPAKKARLVNKGIYSLIRHPMYVFLTLLAVGYCLYFAAFYSLILCVFLIIYFELKTRREERYLRERFAEYSEYSQKTKKFIPFIY